MKEFPFDISLAVQAIRVLFFETHSAEDRQRRVWEPAKSWLSQLAAEDPQALSFLHGPLLPDTTSFGYSCDLYIVAPGQRLVYLATVVSRDEAEEEFRWFQDTFPERADALRDRGAMAITRWLARCILPVPAEVLTQSAIEQGARKYLAEFAPTLASLPIAWLDDELQNGLSLSGEILHQAVVTRRRQTREECLRIVSDDL